MLLKHYYAKATDKADWAAHLAVVGHVGVLLKHYYVKATDKADRAANLGVVGQLGVLLTRLTGLITLPVLATLVKLGYAGF